MAAGLIARAGGDAKVAVARDRCGARQGACGIGSGAQQTPGLDNDTVRVLDQAEQVAQKAGDSYVTVERLLLALALATTTAAGKALADGGADARGAQQRDQRTARRPHRRHRERRGPL